MSILQCPRREVTGAYFFWDNKPVRELSSKVIATSLALQSVGLCFVCRGLPITPHPRNEHRRDGSVHGCCFGYCEKPLETYLLEYKTFENNIYVYINLKCLSWYDNVLTRASECDKG